MILIIRCLNASAISALQSGTKATKQHPFTYHSTQDVCWIWGNVGGTEEI